MIRKNLLKNSAFILIVLAYAIYAGAFIYRTSFEVNGERYFSLFDDAMISMRYAKNLANGHGLIWNPGGEKVEGYTNLLWVLYMSIFHLLPIQESKVSLFIQITGALLLIANLYFVRKISYLISGSDTVSLGAIFLTAFYLPLNNWTLQGMEVGLLTLIMSIAIFQVIQCLRKEKFCFWIYVLLGASTLVRIDMIVPAVGILLYLIISDPKNRRKNILLGASIILFFVVIQTVFRIMYYGDILPNTYYLKMTGYPLLLRISRGLGIFLKFIWMMNLILFLLAFSVFLFRRDKFICLLFWVFLVQIMYSIYVGGDAWEWWGGSNRYISIVIPIFFILFSYSLLHIVQFISKKINGKEKFVPFLYAISLIYSLLSFNSIYGPTALGEFLLITPPLHTQGNKEMVERAILLREFTSPEAKVGVVWAGVLPYFSNRYAIDFLGKNDRQIAREKMRTTSGLRKFLFFYPGHLKYNYAYSIGQLKPDIIEQSWHSWEEAKPYLNTQYVEIILQKKFILWVRKDSKYVWWDKIEKLY